MADVAVLMPSLRPATWDAIRDNLSETSPNARLYPLGEQFNSYAEAVNESWQTVSEPFLFLGADDCLFHEGWADAALALMDDEIRVVGTNDLRNPYVLEGWHSTHSLVDRRYIERVGGVIDAGPGSFLYPYDHSYTDSEFIETAIAREVFAPCADSVVEHFHPDFHTREPDEIHHKTRRRIGEDFETFCDRRHLWGEVNPELIYHRP